MPHHILDCFLLRPQQHDESLGNCIWIWHPHREKYILHHRAIVALNTRSRVWTVSVSCLQFLASVFYICHTNQERLSIRPLLFHMTELNTYNQNFMAHLVIILTFSYVHKKKHSDLGITAMSNTNRSTFSWIFLTMSSHRAIRLNCQPVLCLWGNNVCGPLT